MLKIKIVVLLTSILLLTSCGIEGWEIEKAVERCKEHKGVDHFNIAGTPNSVVCGDGTAWKITPTKTVQ